VLSWELVDDSDESASLVEPAERVPAPGWSCSCSRPTGRAPGTPGAASRCESSATRRVVPGLESPRHQGPTARPARRPEGTRALQPLTLSQLVMLKSGAPHRHRGVSRRRHPRRPARHDRRTRRSPELGRHHQLRSRRPSSIFRVGRRPRSRSARKVFFFFFVRSPHRVRPVWAGGDGRPPSTDVCWTGLLDRRPIWVDTHGAAHRQRARRRSAGKKSPNRGSPRRGARGVSPPPRSRRFARACSNTHTTSPGKRT